MNLGNLSPTDLQRILIKEEEDLLLHSSSLTLGQDATCPKIFWFGNSAFGKWACANKKDKNPSLSKKDEEGINYRPCDCSDYNTCVFYPF
jgi:hypothetical protein